MRQGISMSLSLHGVANISPLSFTVLGIFILTPGFKALQ